VRARTRPGRAPADAPSPRAVGISLKSQQVTALFLAVRLGCSLMMEYDVHTVLDAATLAATAWVLFSMRTKLARGYQSRKDSFPLPALLGVAFGLACVAHPATRHPLPYRIAWALCVYLEAVSVLPQLRMLQREPVVERWTANYVFALGVARFLSCAHWVLQLFDGNSFLFTAFLTKEAGRPARLQDRAWPAMVLVSEVVQTFILADFCYFYVKSAAAGEAVMRMPSLV